VILVDAAVEDGDADACSHGGVPGAVGGATGDAGAEAAGFEDGPGLRSGGVVGVVGGDGGWGWGWSWRGGRVGAGVGVGVGWRGCAGGDSDGGGEDGAKDEGVCGEDAVVDDELDVGSARRAAMAAASSLAPEAVSMTLMPMGLSLRTMRTPATRARAPASAGMELSR